MTTAAQLKALRLYNEARAGNMAAQFALTESIAGHEFPTQIAPAMVRQLRKVFHDTEKLSPLFTTRKTVNAIDVDEELNLYSFDDQSNINAENNGETFVRGGLPAMGARQLYPNIKFQASGKKLRARKLGEAFTFDWEAQIRSRGTDIDMLGDAVEAFGRHAGNQEEIDVAKLLVTGTGFNTAGLPDAQAISGNPDLTNPESLQLAIRSAIQTQIDGEEIGYGKFVLLTTPQYAPVARQTLQTRRVERIPARTGAGSTSVGTGWESQIDYGADITVVGWKWLSRIWSGIGNGWMLIPTDNPDQYPALSSNYLKGAEEPTFWVKDPNARVYGGGEVPVLDGDFDSDGIATKVRHVHGSTPLWTHGIRYSTGTNT